MNVVSNAKEMLRGKIEESLFAARKAGRISFEEIAEFQIEIPKEKSHGDFSVNVAMKMAKAVKENPRKLAETILSGLEDTEGFIGRAEVAGPGFINFYLETSWLYPVVPAVLSEGDGYGSSPLGAGEKVQIEFVSANPTGLLHMGNARGAAIGDSLARVMKMAGYDVQKEFYINDAGNQILNFSRSLEARYFQLVSDPGFPLPEEGYHGEDIKDTVRRYVEKEGDRLLSVSEEERLAVLTEFALAEKKENMKKDLLDFGVEYDVWFSEKDLHEQGKVEEAVRLLKEKDLIYEEEGALWFRFSKYAAGEKDEVVVRSNGVPTYFAADIAYHKDKFERGFKKLINIWGADHHGHVARMKGAADALGFDPDSLTVILMQLVRLFQGGEVVRMSKRTGKFVSLNELVSEVGRDAARFFFVMRNPDSHLDFDLDLAKSESADNPVYYVQYAHARICSIVQAAGMDLPDSASVDYSLLSSPSEVDLLRKIADLPEETAVAAQLLEPHRIARYAQDLASLFHGFYNNCRVLVEDEKLRDARLLLARAAGVTLKNSLDMLGVSAPEQM